MPMLALYGEIDSLTPSSCASGRPASSSARQRAPRAQPRPLDTRLFWMYHADGFLINLVFLKDPVNADQKSALNDTDLRRMMTVVRNATVHQVVVSKGSPLNMLLGELLL
jgi:hypothetical protein